MYFRSCSIWGVRAGGQPEGTGPEIDDDPWRAGSIIGIEYVPEAVGDVNGMPLARP